MTYAGPGQAQCGGDGFRRVREFPLPRNHPEILITLDVGHQVKTARPRGEEVRFAHDSHIVSLPNNAGER